MKEEMSKLGNLVICTAIIANLVLASSISNLSSKDLEGPLANSPKTIWVDDDFVDDPPNHKWDTIQEGVDDAIDGDTVFVFNGTYYENVLVDKTISLTGEDKTETIVNGGGIGDVVNVTSDWVNITGFTMSKGGVDWWFHRAGTKLYNVKNCYVYDNIISDNEQYGLLLQGSNNNTISDNILVSNYWGMYIDSSNHSTVASNTVSGGLRGILFYNSSSNTITNNTVNSVGEGLEIAWSFDTFILSNNVSSNLGMGITLWFSARGVVLDNNVTDNLYGIYAVMSNDSAIIDNSVIWNERSGIHLLASTNITLAKNTMVENSITIYGPSVERWNTHTIETSNTVNGKPVYYWKDGVGGTVPEDAGEVILANCSEVFIENQNIGNASIGIQLGYSPNNTIANNSFFPTYGWGAQLYKSHDNALVNNTISGLCVIESDNNYIAHNIASNSTHGIYTRNSNNTRILNNRIFNNSWSGIMPSHSHNSTISNNVVSSNYDGVFFHFSDGNIFSGNIVTLSERNGVYFTFSNHHTVTHNVISSNIRVGIYLDYYSRWNDISNNTVSDNLYGFFFEVSVRNAIYHNNILDNENQAIDDHASDNDWHHPLLLEGNYWSDYNGSDDGSGTGKHAVAGDLIGDTLIPHPGKDYDFYPCTIPNCWIAPLDHPPIADAGPSQTIFEGEIASFDGSLSVGSQGDKVFSQNIRVNEHDPLSLGVNSEPQMRVDGHGIVHVIWKDRIEQKPNVALYYSQSADGGLSFGDDTRLVNVTGVWPNSDSLNPRFDIDGNRNIHVVWTSVDESGTIPTMYYSKSSDNGSSFDEPRIVLTMNVTADLSVDGENNIHLLAHGLPWDLYHLISRNGGESFGELVRVNDLDVLDTSNIEPELSRMVVDKSGDIHVIWPGQRQGEPFTGDIFYSKSEDGGQSFSNNIKVHDETGDVFRTIGGLDVDSTGNPHVIWIEKNLTEEFDRMAYTKSINKGKTFQNKTFVRDDRYAAVGAGFFTGPSITIGPDDVPRIAWTESFKSVLDCNVWFSKFDEATGNFSHRILVTDHGRNDTMQGWQSLALDENLDTHIVWMDTREGDIQIYYSRTIPGRVAIMSYEWDMNDVADSDGDGNYTNDVDATGSTPAFAYGDDGTYMVTLKVTDEVGAIDYDTTFVTVLNVDPIVSPISYQAEELNASVMFRIAGEKWHDVEVHLFEDDVEIGYARLARSPGSPNDQMAFLADISVDFSKEYSANVYYTPEDDPVNGQEWGAIPAWLILNFDDEEKRIHHTFNVRQEDTWVWNAENLNQYFPFVVSFEAIASDLGSDDLTFTWDWGDGASSSKTYYNDGVGPDPYPSPGGKYPFSATDMVEHTYGAGDVHTVTVTVEDDDGGIGTATFTIRTP